MNKPKPLPILVGFIAGILLVQGAVVASAQDPTAEDVPVACPPCPPCPEVEASPAPSTDAVQRALDAIHAAEQADIKEK